MSPRSPRSPRSSKPKKPLVPEVLPADREDEELTEDSAAGEEEGPDDIEIDASEPDERGLARIESTEAPEVLDKEIAAISPTDPLRRYMDEVRRYALLSVEEELKLARKMIDEGDVNAAKALVSANLRLVVKIAFEYRSLYTNVMDLIQEGNIGLMKAVSKYDPTKGARLGYYASWWIRSYILKYLLDNFRLVKVGTTQSQKKLFYHLVREKERLEAQGLLAGPKLLAEKLDVREKDVIEMQGRLSGAGAEMSLDAPLDREATSGGTHLDALRDPAEGADDALMRGQLVELIRQKIPVFEKSLNEKERQLLHERLLADEPKTLQEVADRYGLTRERARQIEAKVVEKLRKFLGF